ncbi:M24 family metallopeptidase [Jongsikchunia kroppenstedtii]|uniref:M24 family metallopeptidase n=1 Tax=Jongsikchunia kroppenstedtii TaxID=1121721 RepID=UPI00035D652A|nr:Xaa-Pro peptidase family protein [Jongsikchunia kroppenstedtii]
MTTETEPASSGNAADNYEEVTGISDEIGPNVRALQLLPPFPPHRIPRGARPHQLSEDQFPRLSHTEKRRRWDGLRKRMLMRGIDALILLGNDIYWDMGNANLRYVTGIAAKMGSHALFLHDADPVLYNAVPHMSRPFHQQASVQDWVTDIRIGHGVPELAAELRDRGLDRGRLGVVGFSSTIQTTATFLDGELSGLRAMLPDADLVDFSDALQHMRMVKSEEEIDMMRRGARIGRKVLDTLVASARPGVTEAEVYADMIRTQIANGAEPNIFNLLASGPVEHPSDELWHLLHGNDQPVTPTMRPLQQGDLIVTEWHTKFGGYLVHTEYTVYLGDAVPQPLQDIWDVSLECLDATREAFRPGVTLREAWEATRKPAERAGYDFVELGFHAMGLASPEFPTVIYRPGYGSPALNGSRIGGLVLEAGMTFGNNIDLHNPAWKPDVGAMLSDFMVVREGGAEMLVGTPRHIGLGGELS